MIGAVMAYRQVSSILYTELRRQAAHRVRGARSGDTLQATALVHETFIKSSVGTVTSGLHPNGPAQYSRAEITAPRCRGRKAPIGKLR
jgi:hypothetical protein